VSHVTISLIHAGSVEEAPNGFYKTVRRLLKTSKKQRLKRSRLEERVAKALSISVELVSKRLQKRIDSEKLVQDRHWVMINCVA
jgi:hypothetical protein